MNTTDITFLNFMYEEVKRAESLKSSVISFMLELGVYEYFLLFISAVFIIFGFWILETGSVYYLFPTYLGLAIYGVVVLALARNQTQLISDEKWELIKSIPTGISLSTMKTLCERMGRFYRNEVVRKKSFDAIQAYLVDDPFNERVLHTISKNVWKFLLSVTPLIALCAGILNWSYIDSNTHKMTYLFTDNARAYFLVFVALFYPFYIIIALQIIQFRKKSINLQLRNILKLMNMGYCKCYD